MHSFRPWVTGLLLLVTSQVILAAGPPCVRFDVARTVEAEDVTPEEFHQHNPHEKLIRLRLSVSSLISLGRENSLRQTLFVISSEQSPFQIVDYSPKTELESNVAGHVVVEESQGSSTSLGLKAHLPREFPVKGDASAAVGQDASQSVRYERLPDLDVVAASGTLGRGRAVYFKLRPNHRTTLEGDKQFEILARVPRGWRADLLQVRCQAFSQPRGTLLSAVEEEANFVCVDRSFLVGAFLQGDSEAHASVQQWITSARTLRSLAETQASQVRAERYRHWGHKLGAALSIAKPRIPYTWVRDILAAEQAPDFTRHLPTDVRQAANRYHRARDRVASLAG